MKARAITPEQAEQLREHMRRATASVFEILLDQYGIEDRMKVLQAAWNKSVLPSLTNDAERRTLELETFRVPFPADVLSARARQKKRRRRRARK